MYQRIETPLELDDGPPDLYAYEFLELFNDEKFDPEIPEAVCGVTEDLLIRYVSTLHPH